MKNKLILFSLVFFITITITSCGKQVVSDSSGNILKYEIEEVVNDSEKDSMYVYNKDDTLSPLLSSVEDFDSIADKSSLTRFIYWNNNDINNDKNIPLVRSEDKIIAVYSQTSDLPTNIVLEKYEDKGYTIGGHIGLDEDDKTALLYTNFFETSDLANTIKDLKTSDENFVLEEINNKTVPIENIDTNMDFFLGMEKDKKYNLKFYVGTKYQKIDVIADTHIMQSSKVIKLNNPYSKTKDGYFEINLPNDLEDGYYYLSDIGLFKYKK